MPLPWVIAIVLVTAGASLLADHLVRAQMRKKRIAAARDRATSILDKANDEARSIKEEAALESRVKIEAAVAQAESEAAAKLRAVEESTRDIENRERNLLRKTTLYEERVKQIESREKSVEQTEREAAEAKAAAQKAVAEQRARLEQISGYSSSMAKKELMREMEVEARRDAAVRIHRVEEEARERGVEQARWAITQALQRFQPPQYAESTVTLLDLPSDEMKGRVIGREGRNIRSIEMATGIDMIIDDTPHAIILSSFNPTRRAIARIALERLIEDGRIHPARIEEVVAKVKEDFERILTETGEAAAFELGLQDVNPRLLKMAGKLQSISFHGQNLLQHSREVAMIATHIGALLGVPCDVIKRAALFHKIGFADEANLDRSPLLLSADVAQRLGEAEPVVHAIQALYGIVPSRSVDEILLQVAETASVSRPGAQKEMLQSYLERLQGLEEIAKSFPGVKEVFAMRAGKEVRVIVEPDRLGDKEVVWLSRDIAKRIEKEIAYPGQVRISVVRETRSVDFAM